MKPYRSDMKQHWIMSYNTHVLQREWGEHEWKRVAFVCKKWDSTKWIAWSRGPDHEFASFEEAKTWCEEQCPIDQAIV